MLSFFLSCSVSESHRKNVEEQQGELLKVWLLHFTPHLKTSMSHASHLTTATTQKRVHALRWCDSRGGWDEALIPLRLKRALNLLLSCGGSIMNGRGVPTIKVAGGYVTCRFYHVASEATGTRSLSSWRATWKEDSDLRGWTVFFSFGADPALASLCFSNCPRPQSCRRSVLLVQRSKGQIGEVKIDGVARREVGWGETYFSVTLFWHPVLGLEMISWRQVGRGRLVKAGTHDGTKVLVCERNL